MLMQTAFANFAKDPQAGPGWDALTALGENVACIGCSGSSSEYLINAASIDTACLVVNAAYALFTSLAF